MMTSGNFKQFDKDAAKAIKNMKNIPAYQLLLKSDSQSIDGNGEVDTIEFQAGVEKSNFDNNAIAVSFYTDNENYTFEYHFTKQNLIDAKIKKNKITITDTENNDVIISCFVNAPATL